jgi:YHS domain-containing protein
MAMPFPSMPEEVTDQQVCRSCYRSNAAEWVLTYEGMRYYFCRKHAQRMPSFKDKETPTYTWKELNPEKPSEADMCFNRHHN